MQNLAFSYIAALCLLASVLSAAAQPQESKPSPRRMIVHQKWGYLAGTQPSVIKDQPAWEAFWKQVGKPAPPVDFRRRMVIHAVATLPDSTWRFHGVVIQQHPDHIDVRIHTTSNGSVGLQAVTYDGGLYVVDRSDLPVLFGPLLD